MKNLQSIQSYFKSAFFLLILLTMQACSKGTEEVITSVGEASVVIDVSSDDGQTLDLMQTTDRAKTLAGATEEQVDQAIAFSASKSIAVSLRPQVQKQSLSNKLQSSSASTSALSAANPLKNGVKFGLLIYDDKGVNVENQSYTFGTGNNIVFKLDAGKSYTLIAYSINSTTDLPPVNDYRNIKTATVSEVSADLMYYKTDVVLKFGVNRLNLNLKHLFSEVTTVMTIDPNTTGAFTAIQQAVIKPTHSHASMSLATSALTYNGINKAGASVVFPSLGTAGLRTVNSVPTLLIHPTATNGSINFGSITIDEETKTNISLSNLKINPGYKYNLNLNFKTCTKDVVGATDLNWSYADVTVSGKRGIMKDGVFVPNGTAISRKITAPGADYGFVFDITELDNAFNLEVNGVKMAAQEIQFQINGSSTQNIQFADGSKYEGVNSQGGANIQAIYSMRGTELKPLIKVVISRAGVVSMFGSKVSGGPLFPLVLSNGNKFNTFVWSNAASNTVNVSQLVDGLTVIRGFGSGKAKIVCN